jgi:hypothetical protein
MYDKATIDKGVYEKFRDKMDGFLSAGLTHLMFANFLRCHSEYQKHFQFCHKLRGEQMFVKAEVLFHYEHGSTYRIYDATFDKLLADVSTEDYVRYKVIERLCCEQFMAFVDYEKIDINDQESRGKLAEYLSVFVPDARSFVEKLYSFLHMEARLPDVDKEYASCGSIDISAQQSREEVIEHLEGLRGGNAMADLAFYAYRDMSRCKWEPFMRAAIDRNPVSIEAMKDESIEQVYQQLGRMENYSIYDGSRVAQPDEVVNFKRGDGVEKAILLANIINARGGEESVTIEVAGERVLLKAGGDYEFASNKGLEATLRVRG